MRLFEGFDAASDLATALNGLNAGTSATFINANKAQLQDSVVDASSDTFLTNLGSLQQAATTATSTKYYSDQSRNLNNSSSKKQIFKIDIQEVNDEERK
jgi:hypothetical protein